MIARFTIREANNDMATPVYIDLDPLTSVADSALTLQEVNGNTKTQIPFQVENSYHRFIWWMVKSNSSSQKNRVFELLKSATPGKNNPGSTAAALQLSDKDGALIISGKNKQILQYNYKVAYPPAGIDTVFRRSGFIHPLWSPAGNVLTRINPPDHYHHVGIWNPWTKVLFEGKVVDFWNLNKKEGTVRFSKFIEKVEGSVYGGFKALHEHVVLNKTPEKVAMNETWDIRAYQIADNMWLWDFTSVLSCATDSPVLLEAYRYGGFGFRATEAWNNKNSTVLTSEGKTRKEADSSSARWCIIEGDINSGHSGIVFMSYPGNYNYPEPMRVWPENMNNRGDVFFSFSPTKSKDWSIEPNKPQVLKYRMLVYDGKITPAQAEAAWKNFAEPLKIIVSKTGLK